MGIWAPIIYILIYSIATICILPSTPLNLSGGAIFGAAWGTVWTSIAAILAAILSFAFSRSIGRSFVEQKLAGKWQSIDLLNAPRWFLLSVCNSLTSCIKTKLLVFGG